jgi:hypothetical protein
VHCDIDQDEHIHSDMGDVEDLILKLPDEKSSDQNDERGRCCCHGVNLRKLGQNSPRMGFAHQGRMQQYVSYCDIATCDSLA